MYEAFYGLTCKPFDLSPDPRFIFLSEQHETALSLLEYSALNQAGFVVITGEIGAGKTTLLKQLLSNLQDNFVIAEVGFTHIAFGGLMDWIADAFGLPDAGSEAANHKQLFNFLKAQIAAKKRLLLVVDEAQNLSEDLMEQLRLLSNFNVAGHSGLQIILSGQPELRDLLRSKKLVQFAQRIAADFHLMPLTTQQGAEYIAHRVKVAGGSQELFDASAKKLAAYYAKGVPRLINNICDMALVYGYGSGAKTISSSLIKEVVNDKRQQGMLVSFAENKA